MQNTFEKKLITKNHRMQNKKKKKKKKKKFKYGNAKLLIVWKYE